MCPGAATDWLPLSLQLHLTELRRSSAVETNDLAAATGPFGKAVGEDGAQSPWGYVVDWQLPLAEEL